MMRKLTDKPPIRGSIHGDGPGFEDGMTCTEDFRCEACKLSTSYPRDGKKATGPFTWLHGHPYCEVCYPRMVAVLEADEKLAALQGKSEELLDLGTAEQWAASRQTDYESYLRTQAEAAEIRRGIEARAYWESLKDGSEMRELAKAVAEGRTHPTCTHVSINQPPDGATLRTIEPAPLPTDVLFPPQYGTREDGSIFPLPYKGERWARASPHGIICKVPDGFPFEGKDMAHQQEERVLERIAALDTLPGPNTVQEHVGDAIARQCEERVFTALAALAADLADEPTVVKAKPEDA